MTTVLAAETRADLMRLTGIANIDDSPSTSYEAYAAAQALLDVDYSAYPVMDLYTLHDGLGLAVTDMLNWATPSLLEDKTGTMRQCTARMVIIMERIRDTQKRAQLAARR